MSDTEFTPAELATIRAEDIVREMVSMSWNEEIEFIAGLLRELDAAKKVADAAAEYTEFTGYEDLGDDRWLALADAIREYRALTEGKETDD